MKQLFIIALILVSCQSKQSIQTEYDSVLSRIDQSNKSLKATEAVYQSMKDISPEDYNKRLLRQVDSITIVIRDLEKRRQELAGKLYDR
jgi:uncharacterized protein YcfL